MKQHRTFYENKDIKQAQRRQPGGFLHTHLKQIPHAPKKRAGHILVGDTTAKTTGGRRMVLQVFIRKFLFCEINVVFDSVRVCAHSYAQAPCPAHARVSARQLVPIAEEHHSQETITRKIKYRAGGCGITW